MEKDLIRIKLHVYRIQTYSKTFNYKKNSSNILKSFKACYNSSHLKNQWKFIYLPENQPHLMGLLQYSMSEIDKTINRISLCNYVFFSENSKKRWKYESIYMYKMCVLKWTINSQIKCTSIKITSFITRNHD